MRSIYSIHMFYPIIYAFAAHEHRHVPRARARQERVLDGRAIDDDVARRSAPTCACDSAGPRWSTAPRFAIHRSAATIFRRVCVIVIQMQRMRRERRFLLECPRSCCRYGGRCRSEEEDPSQAARRSRFRAALPPRGRWQEVASSIRARPGLPGRWAGAPATGPGRWPWRTRGGARRRPKPRQNRSTAWVSGARIDWARSSLRKNGQGGSQPRGGPRGARRACGRAPGAIKS